MECIILSVNDTYMDAQEVMHMTDYSKITALYWHGIGCMFCYREQLTPKAGGKNEP